ncbi:hypothetical protein Hanom_Chr10g00933951 [Helianthus anomalus]
MDGYDSLLPISCFCVLLSQFYNIFYVLKGNLRILIQFLLQKSACCKTTFLLLQKSANCKTTFQSIFVRIFL